MPLTLSVDANRLPGMVGQQAAFLDGQHGSSGRCTSPRCASSRAATPTPGPLAWWRQDLAAGEETPPRTRTVTRRPCEPYDLPWGEVDPDCFPVRNGRRMSARELEELCDLPCATGGEGLPRAELIDQQTEELRVTFRWGAGVPAQKKAEWEELIRCGWTLLRENLDLVRFLMCVLTGDPEASTCLTKRIDEQRPDIHLNFLPSAQVGATTLDVEQGLLAAILGGAMFGPGAGLWAGAAWLLNFDDVVWFTELTNHDSMYNSWVSGDYRQEACACMFVAGMLLHETVHTCLRDLSLDHEGDDCSLAEQLDSGFVFLVFQRYHETVDAPTEHCCKVTPSLWLADWDPPYPC